MLNHLSEWPESSVEIGHSQITLLLAPTTSVSQMVRVLKDEASACGILSRFKRLAFLSICYKVIDCLEKYAETPPNGLAVFCGLRIDSVPEIPQVSDIGKMTKLVHFEPLGALSQSIYRIEGRFSLKEITAATWTEVVWEPSLNQRFPQSFQRGVRQVLLIFQRLKTQKIVAIPDAVLMLILSHIPFDGFGSLE